ncbi:HIT domain-containing protein [Aliihoeflea aestuarii]|jgi:diadenosine tetraphosphate (Ap4A) HIT family hydrolase|uniref:HIT domain-containing protein n=1 Tax=Aliihoeflea aestuarii TaxID=453840 RepID=UPI0035577B0A
MDMPHKAGGFELDRKLERDTWDVIWLGLCELRIMNDARWPWLILIPQRRDAVEIHDLTPLDQAMLSFETNLVSKTLLEVTGCDKINTGALGNVVRQLHVHVVARRQGDANWPGPVWGFGQAEPYRREDLHSFVNTIKDRL